MIMDPRIAGLIYIATQAVNAYTSFIASATTETVEEAEAHFKKTQDFVADSGKLWDAAGEES